MKNSHPWYRAGHQLDITLTKIMKKDTEEFDNTTIKIPLRDIQQAGKVMGTDRLMELIETFNEVFGIYDYNAQTEYMFWETDTKTFIEFVNELGDDLYHKLHIMLPGMLVE
jgi:hypothetical protein